MKTTNYLIVLFLFSISFNNLFGQKIIKGLVLDESLNPLPYAMVFDSDTSQLGYADINGYFELSIPEKTSEIIFGYIGFEYITIYLNDSCNYIEVIVLHSGTYDIKSHTKIDRLRKKEYKKVPELHKKAFNEGKFIYSEICYTSEFIPYKPALDIIRKRFKERRKVNKNDFIELNIGDIVKIPFRIDTSSNENIISTHYSPCINCTEEDFIYFIKGEIINKHKKNLTLEIKITEMLRYDFLKYKGQILKIDSTFKYEMKYFEVIIEKKR